MRIALIPIACLSILFMVLFLSSPRRINESAELTFQSVAPTPTPSLEDRLSRLEGLLSANGNGQPRQKDLWDILASLQG
jgi:hypothetical protein